MTVRALAEVIGVEVDEEDPGAPSTVDAFEYEIERLKQAGKTPRVVILCNPNNPLGFNYTRETVLAYCRLCEKYNLHLVSDEIYALSQFRHPDVDPASVVPFTSILSIDILKEANCNPARVHVLYGMSKDFGANGLRIGL
jgi:1-aminocyclopropane-1-carboxylate synthase